MAVRCQRTVWIICLFVTCSAAFGIIRRHDRDDAQYVALGKKYPAVTQLGGGTGTLIGDRWLITAAHVVANLSPLDTAVQIGGRSYAIKGVSRHPKSKSGTQPTRATS